jgi:hypothetical protein
MFTGAFLLLFLALCFAPAILSIIAMWKVYAKAGQPGWAAFVPFYNLYIQLKMVGRPGWWLLLYFVPLVNLVIAIMVTVELARVFGKGVGFALGLIFLPFIFWLILGFGDARYAGTAPALPAAA